MENNYLFLPVSPLGADSVLALMEVLDGELAPAAQFLRRSI